MGKRLVVLLVATVSILLFDIVFTYQIVGSAHYTQDSVVKCYLLGNGVTRDGKVFSSTYVAACYIAAYALGEQPKFLFRVDRYRNNYGMEYSKTIP